MRNNKAVDLVEQARQLRIQAEALTKAARLARGTAEQLRQEAARAHAKPARGPYWVGDEGTTEELMSVVQQMITERPRLFVELLEATGARDNRIKGVLMRLQREGVRVVDVAPAGTGKALWFIPSDEAVTRIRRAAKLATKRAP